MTQKEGSVLDDTNFVCSPIRVEETSGRASAPSSDQPELIPFAAAEPISSPTAPSSSPPAWEGSSPFAGSSSPSDPEHHSSRSSSTARIDITQSVPDDQKHLVAPAGVGAAVLGFLLGGPILSALLGFGSAYAVRKDGTAGDVARSVGEVTLSVKQTAVTIEEKHGFFGRTKKAVDDITGNETRNSLAFKTRVAIVSSWRAVANFTREHQLIERGVENTGKGIEYVAGALTRREKQER
jgi:hypothetical protein